MPEFSPGDAVVIVGGTAAGHSGTVTEVDDQTGTVLVRASVFDREVSVRAALDEIRAPDQP